MSLFRRRYIKKKMAFPYSAILMDLSRYFKSSPNGLDDFNRLGIECFLIITLQTDKKTIATIEKKYNLVSSVIGSNVQYSREELIKNEKSSKLVLPHANYNDLNKIKRFLTKLRADNPNIFNELKERPFIDVHNELMQKYTHNKDASV